MVENSPKRRHNEDIRQALRGCYCSIMSSVKVKSTCGLKSFAWINGRGLRFKIDRKFVR